MVLLLCVLSCETDPSNLCEFLLGLFKNIQLAHSFNFLILRLLLTNFCTFCLLRSFLLDLPAAGLAEALGTIPGYQRLVGSSRHGQDPF